MAPVRRDHGSVIRHMRVFLVALAACGGAATNAVPAASPSSSIVPIHVEWKVEQGEGHTVNVSLVVEGTSIFIGALDAASEYEAGTPATCALRAANPRRTEIVCGDSNSYAADLVGPELLVTLVTGEQRSEVKRVPVNGDELAVKMLALPFVR